MIGKRINELPREERERIFIERSTKIHNGFYGYESVKYSDRKTKVTITCPIHGDFQQVPDAHLRGCGCPVCRYIKSSSKVRMSQGEFIRRATEKHNGKYDYSKAEYKHTDTKVCIICPKHGEFWQTPHHHLMGIGCPTCGSGTHTTEEFIELARDKHGNKYDYSKTEYINKRHKVTIICPEHGEFHQLPFNHLDGRGCPECGAKFCTNEKRILQALKDEFGEDNVKYQHTESFLKVKKKPMYLDAYIPEYKVAVEYQGEEHFQPVNIFGGEKAFKIVSERDKRKFKLCQDNGIKLFYVSFSRYIPEEYISEVFTSTDGLISAVQKYINQQ